MHTVNLTSLGRKVNGVRYTCQVKRVLVPQKKCDYFVAVYQYYVVASLGRYHIVLILKQGNKVLTLFTSIVSTLEKQFQPVITDYDLSLLILKICHGKKTHMNVLNKSPDLTTRKTLNAILNGLLEFNILTSHKDFTGISVYSIVQKSQSDVNSIGCAVDPFLYISHLTAMGLYGMSNTACNEIYITDPLPDKWSELAEKKMLEDKKLFQETSFKNALPPLLKPKFTKIGDKKVIRFINKSYGQFNPIKNSNVRLSPLGRTFYDMVNKPDYCGNMHHVLDVFKEFGPQYCDLIIEEIDKYATPIEKVRAGYILEEFCGIKNRIIESWTAYCQRGGSRKLDPTQKYKPVFSERWCLSINL